jgi:hypothetical protein
MSRCLISNLQQDIANNNLYQTNKQTNKFIREINESLKKKIDNIYKVLCKIQECDCNLGSAAPNLSHAVVNHITHDGARQ